MADFLTEYANPPADDPAAPAAPADQPYAPETIVPYADPAPHAASVAGPIADPSTPVAPAQLADAPENLQSSYFSGGVMQRLNEENQENPDLAFDDAMSISRGKLQWALTAFKGVNPDVAAGVSKLAKYFGTDYRVPDHI